MKTEDLVGEVNPGESATRGHVKVRWGRRATMKKEVTSKGAGTLSPPAHFVQTA